MEQEQEQQQEPSTCFIITQKYDNRCTNYIKTYVDNIKAFYSRHFILIVDNNSENLQDIRSLCENYSDLMILVNEGESKYEIGGYIYGLNWLIQHQLIREYDYFIFSQDNFILMNKYDFRILKYNNIEACSIVEHGECFENFWCPVRKELIYKVLDSIGLLNNMDKFLISWGSTFVCNKNKILDLFNYIKDIVAKTKIDSECSERYMGRIIFELNNHRTFNIDGLLFINQPYYFNKISQRKT